MAYDEKSLDFVKSEIASSRGSFVHYIVHCRSGRIAVETSQDISPAAARAVLQKFFNAPYTPRAYIIDFIPDVEFHEWVSQVGEISELQVSISRPNPDWDKVPRLGRRVLRPSDAKTLEMVIRASRGEHLRLDDPDLRDVTNYSLEHDQGVHAASTDGSRFNSRRNAKNRPMHIEEDDMPRRRFIRLQDLLEDLFDDLDNEDEDEEGGRDEER
ncbi:MAG: hypothetical protein F4Y03_06685 [Alphaproteobacteria bacterium]|nr:hypothetical protein [Alphaproteobacteria bacterium]